MGKTTSTWARRCRAGLYLILTSALLLEITLRIWAMFPEDSEVFVSDPAVGFRIRPHTPVGQDVANARGFNDVDHPNQSPHGVQRIAVIGDSFVFGAVPRRDNMVSALDALINPRGERFDVRNMGIPSAGPENYLGVLEHEALEQAADLIYVVLFVGNDIIQSHPDFEIRVWFGAPRLRLRSPFRLGPSVDYLYALRLLRAGRRMLRERLAGTERAPGGAFSNDVFLAIERQRMEVCRRRQSRHLQASYRGTAELFGRMKTLSDRAGKQLVVILAPDQYQVEAALRSEVLSTYRLDPSRYDFDQPQRLLREALGARGVEVIDLLPDFRQQSKPSLYLPRNTHWNRQGNALAAAIVAASLDGSGQAP